MHFIVLGVLMKERQGNAIRENAILGMALQILRDPRRRHGGGQLGVHGSRLRYIRLAIGGSGTSCYGFLF